MRGNDLRCLGWVVGTYIRPHWRGVAVLLLASAAGTGLSALLPVLMAPILDLALGTSSQAGAPVALPELSLKNLGAAFFQWVGIGTVDDRFRAIVILSAAYVVVGVLKAWIDFGHYLLALGVRVRAASVMQIDLFRHLLSLPMTFFTRHRTGELISRVEADTRAATGGLETLVGTLVTAPVLILIYGYLLVRTSPGLVAAAAGAAILHYSVNRLVRGPIRRLSTGQFVVFADLMARLQEAILSIRVVKSFAAEPFEVARVARTVAGVVRVNVRYGVYKHVEEPARSVVNYVVEGTILVLAAAELVAGRLGPPAFFLFLYVGRAVMAQFVLLGGASTQLQAVLAAATRVRELMDRVPEISDGTHVVEGFDDRISLDGVSFDYGGLPVLHDVSLEIRKGQVIALVGPSGSGKSTMVDLVLRLYDPVQGRITIDGRDLRELRQVSYRRMFGVVSQEALLFNATVRENIAYGRDDLSMAEIERAARIANAHDFIVELEHGYDTVVGDRGIRLSGGQRQRIAIARAIVGRPQILVLDEATSSLDSESEQLVQQAMQRAIQGTTSIVIAHRLSTVLHADKIVVLNRGRIEGVGRHHELLGVSETYTRLYRLQAGEVPVGNL